MTSSTLSRPRRHGPRGGLSWALGLLGCAATAGCSDAGTTGGPTEPLAADEGGCMDDGDPYDPLGKADGANTSKERPFSQVGHLRFGQSHLVPPDSLRPGWSFHGAAGARITLTGDGGVAAYLYGPKAPGDAWPVPPRELGTAPVTTTLPTTGLYAVAVEPPSSDTTLTAECATAPCTPPTWTGPAPAGALSLVTVGDLGLTVSDAPIDWAGGHKYAEYHYYVEMLEGFYPYLDGDVNLANLETAVTVGGTRQDKTYAFRMPESGLDAILADGFDLVGLANNHAGDFGVAGVLDTLAALEHGVDEGALLGFAGVGTGFAAAARPAIFERSGVRVAFAACGIGFDVQSHGTGIAHVSDCYDVVGGLAGTAADLRLLSVHAGVERELEPIGQVVALARYAADAGVDLVHGHHPHVVQGIERRGQGVILYSMGNFELRGARNMASLGPDRDYGIAARLHFDPTSGRFVDLEVVALYDMHRAVYPLGAADGADRIGRLNERSASLGSGAIMLQLDPTTGHGHATLR
ncbi:MAG: CapA family protein [Deltaproteobacteria bacterium]|nr:CapA family protein [Deltaproteobacteria bacterium]